MTSDRLSVLVDENVPYALETFGTFGSVRTLAGRRITAADVQDADVLIVRSVTRVDRALLSQSRVRFVGTATIGTDHVDVDYLNERGIAFASAPGSNATSVAEYVIAALLLSAHARQASLEGAAIAIIGVGNVGRRVAARAQGLGMQCLLNDPPRQRAGDGPDFVTLDDALARADYVTLHVPLERGGPDATAGMADRRFFEKMKSRAVFLNTSRGGVVDEPALADALDSGRIAQAILDVFRREPDIDAEMVRRAFVATPHIAGYSFDGKVEATLMLYRAFAVWSNRLDEMNTELVLPLSDVPRLDLSGRIGDDEAVLREAVLSVYDIKEDDRALRQAAAQPDAGVQFDLLRKRYRRRRECPHTTLVLSRERDSLIRKAARLGFRVETN